MCFKSELIRRHLCNKRVVRGLDFDPIVYRADRPVLVEVVNPTCYRYKLYSKILDILSLKKIPIYTFDSTRNYIDMPEMQTECYKIVLFKDKKAYATADSPSLKNMASLISENTELSIRLEDRDYVIEDFILMDTAKRVILEEAMNLADLMKNQC